MDLSKLSTNGLLMMHGGIKQSLAVDDNTPADHDKPYGVRKISDWKQWASRIETLLKERKVQFEPIHW